MVAPTRVLVVDPHALLRAGVRAVLDAEPGLEVVATASSAAEALAAARLAQPSLVVLDTHLPDQDAAATCRQLVGLTPRPVVVILSDQIDRATVRACVRAGARGYLLKDLSEDDLRRRVRALVRGERAFDRRIAPLLAVEAPPQAAAAPEALLSGRRRAILQLMTEGLSNREIAQRTLLSEPTVKGYVEQILHALGVRNRVQAAVLAIRRGLI